ncbi:Uncharacterised protein [Vibrio cholerae]|nr:Uncharacterised protein [Vibrio cholerae]
MLSLKGKLDAPFWQPAQQQRNIINLNWYSFLEVTHPLAFTSMANSFVTTSSRLHQNKI